MSDIFFILLIAPICACLAGWVIINKYDDGKDL